MTAGRNYFDLKSNNWMIYNQHRRYRYELSTAGLESKSYNDRTNDNHHYLDTLFFLFLNISYHSCLRILLLSLLRCGISNLADFGISAV